MNFLTSTAGTCCILGRPDIPPGYRATLEHEFDNLVAHGVTCYFFTGLNLFERLCLKALRCLQQTYDFIPIKTILLGTDITLLTKSEYDFDAVCCLRPEEDPSFSVSRVAIEHSRFMVYFQLTDFGGIQSDLIYGEGLGLRAINIAARKKADDGPSASL